MLTSVKNDLQRATPESQGIASSAVLKFIEAVEQNLREMHSFILVRHGNIVAEAWWTPFGRELPHMLFSLSKSFTSTAVGLAVHEGLLSVDDKVLSFFPEYAPAEVSENLAAMRLHDILSMSTGHASESMEHMEGRDDGNWIKGFFTAPVVYKPGTHFVYNSGATYMQSAIVQKVTGQKLIDYLTPRLFEPLGIENPTWQESPQGINTGGWGLNIKTGDIARFGQLYLQKGVWQGTQLVPEAWVKQATSFQIANGDNPESDWNQGYGYQFWRCRNNAYRGDGAFGQYCIVMPDQDAVLAITSGLGDMQQPLNLVWDILLAAMGDALPEDAAAQDKLSAKLATLNIPPVQGKASSPLAAQVSGHTYQIDENVLRFEAITLNFGASGASVTIKTARSEDTYPCGYSEWQKGATAAMNPPEVNTLTPVAASGAWTADDTFTMQIRAYETPFMQTVVCKFAGATLTMDTKINVSFAPIETVTLTGRHA